MFGLSNLLDLWVFKIIFLKLVSFFGNLVFNVNSFKIYVFKDINIKKYHFFNRTYIIIKYFPTKNRKGLSLTQTSTGNDFSKI